VALAHPALPEATPKIWTQLGQSGSLGEFSSGNTRLGGLRPGTRIGELAPIFSAC